MPIDTLEHAHDAVLAVDLEVEVVVLDTVVVKVVLDTSLDTLDDGVDLADHDRVCRSRNRDSAVAYETGTLELEEVTIGGLEDGTRDLDLVVVNLLEVTSVQIERTTRTRQMVRIGLLIERVTSYREGRTLTILGKWLEDEVILAQIAKHTVTTATGQCADSSALEDLTHVQCERTVEALLDR